MAIQTQINQMLTYQWREEQKPVELLQPPCSSQS
jgi:hypothetical protein